VPKQLNSIIHWKAQARLERCLSFKRARIRTSDDPTAKQKPDPGVPSAGVPRGAAPMGWRRAARLGWDGQGGLNINRKRRP